MADTEKDTKAKAAEKADPAAEAGFGTYVEQAPEEPEPDDTPVNASSPSAEESATSERGGDAEVNEAEDRTMKGTATTSKDVAGKEEK